MHKINAIFRNIPLQLHISYLFILLIVIFAAISNGYHYYQTRQFMMEQAHTSVDHLEQVIELELSRLYQPNLLLVELFAQQPFPPSATLDQRLRQLPFLTNILKQTASLSAFYVGFENGDSFVLRRWNGETQAKIVSYFKPPPGTAWIVQNRREQQVAIYVFFDANLRELTRRAVPDYHFDPRKRPWYLPAQQQANTTIISEPYRDFSTRRAEVSLSRQLANSPGVIGVDIALTTIDTLLKQSGITPNTQLALLNKNGDVLSWYGGEITRAQLTKDKHLLPSLAELGSAVLDQLHQQVVQQDNLIPSSGKARHPPFLLTTSHQTVVLKQGDESWQGEVFSLPIVNGKELTLMIASPYRELLAHANKIRNEGFIIAGSVLLLGVLIALAFARLASRPLRALMHEARKIERFEFDKPIRVQSNILEVAQLAGAMGRMKSTIHRFLDLSIALSAETHFPRLLAFLLNEMQEITGAQGGILYLSPIDGSSQLHPIQAAWQGQCLETISALQNVDFLTQPEHPIVKTLTLGKKIQTLSAAVIRNEFGKLIPDSEELTMLALPLSNRSGEQLGALILFVNEKTQSLTPEHLAFAEALSSTASAAIYTQSLIDEQKRLLESFIQLIAGAIDVKSAYTGWHCQRVPELTKMLAQAACDQQHGAFKDFTLTQEQWEELHIAAWLHDCGKITTPEYIVDKATKLETLCDRIHEVRMRFEVLKRDAEIRCWKAIAQGEAAEEKLADMQAIWAQLDDEYAFVAMCNEGSEFMAPEKVTRLQQIAARVWVRTLSDRIGISYDEKIRKEQTPEPSLPTEELLLADKPEHLFERTERDRLPGNNPWGFKMKVPEYLYNRGEIYNLAVSRGTLSAEERYKINEHIIQTIIMLETLPFPRHLRRVPEIAGGHHEKMDGMGYPKKLTGNQMSIEARIMAIADIFEALTAADRPYKKGKTLSEAIKIMASMRTDQHIDAELFELFLRSGVYKKYADTFMKPAQIDDVDINQYI